MRLQKSFTAIVHSGGKAAGGCIEAIESLMESVCASLSARWTPLYVLKLE